MFTPPPLAALADGDSFRPSQYQSLLNILCLENPVYWPILGDEITTNFLRNVVVMPVRWSGGMNFPN